MNSLTPQSCIKYKNAENTVNIIVAGLTPSPILVKTLHGMTYILTYTSQKLKWP